MLAAIFRRCLNPIGTAYTHAKEGRLVSPFRCGEASYSIAKQAVRMIGTMYPPPPREEQKMTLRYTRYLSLLAWVAALVSPLLIAPAVAQTDYDSEDNGYIDITTLAQLNAMRWDLNGDGSLDTLTTASDTMAYQAAFPNAATGMGCPNTGCNGYELKADLDFDNDNSGTVDSSDDYPNWAPIGPFNVNLPSNGAYTGTFKGNNNTISNLTISNNSTSRVGLFGGVAGTITGVGLQDANVTHAVTSGTTLTIRTGALAGVLTGTVRSSWVTGAVSSSSTRDYNYVGGLVGSVLSGGTVAASWADVDASVSAGSMGSGVGGLVGALEALSSGTATVIASYAAGSASNTAAAGNRSAGGLVGYIVTGSSGQYALTASYAAGTVSSAGSSRGLVGNIDGNASGSITASYWDISKTGVEDDANNDAPEGKTASQLHSPTAYGTTGIYSGWNVDVDSDTNSDDPWDFGDANQYPRLKFDGMDLSVQTIAPPIDYDADNNGLIDIKTLAQLDAVRHDLNGDGNPASSGAANYAAAFPNRDLSASGRMGCPDTSDPADNTADCIGYELMNDLDFDTDNSGTVDSNDDYPNWVPIGPLNLNLPSGGAYTGTFKGNNNTISNLTISNNSTSRVGLFGGVAGTITGVGLQDANVTHAVTSGTTLTIRTGALAGVLTGTVRSSWVTGAVSSSSTRDYNYVGGLVGSVLSGGTVAASWADVDASVSAGSMAADVGGLVGALVVSSSGTATIIASYAAGSASNFAPVTSRSTGGLVGYIVTASGGQYALTASYAAGTVLVTTSYHVGMVSLPSAGSSEGLVGRIDGSASGSITASYWDTETATIADDADSAAPEGRTTSQLQSPTDYTGIYSDWNVNVDGNADNDDPWNFGAADQYPVLKFGMDADAIAAQFAAQPLSQVRGVSVTPGPGALVVSWTAASNAEGYKVQWKSGDEGYDAADRQAVVTGTTHTIPNLRADTEYTVRVIATRTNADDGPALDEATGTPGESGTTEPDPDTEPVFIEAADPQTYRQNQAIEFTLPAAIDGNGTLTYTLTDLPEGLTFDAETLVVSGTPSEMTEKAIYTLTVTDEDGDSAVMSFFITVLANVAPSFGDASVSAQSYLRKQEIDSLTLPQAIGGDGSLTYALAPDLPDDLVFDAETRMLSGTPLEVIAETTYTLTATDGDGDAAILTFTLEVMADPMPTFGDTTIAAQFYQHREIEPLTLPQATGGDEPLTYELTPDLPEGLTFDAETLIVSGTPLEAMDAMTYTLTATDGNGDVARLMFSLEIPDLMPTFGDTTLAAQSYLVNQQIESLTLPAATGGDGMLAYFLLPFLPDSLTFDPKTRVLSGTPTEAMTETTYTLSALDADGDVASLTFTLAVQMPSSDFDGDGDVNFADFLTFAGKFGSRRGQDRYDARCDLNGDGQIDFADFLIFAASFGATG